jgi:hypothetical protein
LLEDAADLPVRRRRIEPRLPALAMSAFPVLADCPD